MFTINKIPKTYNKARKWNMRFSFYLSLFLVFSLLAAGEGYGDPNAKYITDTTGGYVVTDTWNSECDILWDSADQRLQVLTGDNVGLKLSHGLSPSDNGTFSIDFLPYAKYPAGGWVVLRLVQDANTYYELQNTDGYGPGFIRKVVGGEVEKVFLNNQYSQDNTYPITITFSPNETTVDAFGEVLVINTDTSSIVVSSFEIEIAQQDAYFDNIVYTISDPTESRVRIIEGDEWSYFKGKKMPPQKWNHLGFDDATWQRGRSQFGYGTGSSATLLSDMRCNYSTLYVRREFTVKPSEAKQMNMSVICKGSFIAYINGIEVVRSKTRFTEPINISSFIHELLPGKNALAIECSNDNINSDSFEFLPLLEILEK